MDLQPNRMTAATVVNTNAQPEVLPDAVPMKDFGKDHWSTFAYLETRIVDYKGVPDREHMRCDAKLHPGLAGRAAYACGDKEYPTKLKGYFLGKGQTDASQLKHNHDDWSCADDLESALLLVNCGTGVNPVFKLTSLGDKVATQLREHKRNGGNFYEFVPVL